MGFNEKNFQRAQENFQQLAQQLNDFTQWALEELKKRDLELKETHIHLNMAKKQIDMLVGELADAKREIEQLKERLAESGQVIAMPTVEVMTPKPQPEETYDELLQRAQMIQQQMGETAPPTSESAHFTMDLAHTGPDERTPSEVNSHTVQGAVPEMQASKAPVFEMDLEPGYEPASLVEEPNPNFFAPAIASLEHGDRASAVLFLNQKEAQWQAGDSDTLRDYFDLMDRMILSATGQEAVVRPAMKQMVRFVVERELFDASRIFVQLNNGALETVILSEETDAQLFMDISVLYFRLMMKYEFKRWIRVNRDQNRLQSLVFQDEAHWNLLYMALYFEQDDVVKEEVSGMKAKILKPIPEAKLYREYVDAVREGRNVEDARDQFEDRTAFMRYVDDSIRNQVFPLMKERLNGKMEEVRRQPEVKEEEPAVIERKPEVEIRAEEPQVQALQEVESVHLVGGDGRVCPSDETAMVYQEVSLRTFPSKTERDMNRGGEYQKVRLLYCPKCHRYYINQFIRWGIAGFICVEAAESKTEHQIG